MAFFKWQIKFIIIILLAMLVFNVPTIYSVCDARLFCKWVDGMDQNGNDFLFLGTEVGAKLI